MTLNSTKTYEHLTHESWIGGKFIAGQGDRFGDHHIHGAEGVRFYAQVKAVTTRWPHVSEQSLVQLSFPTAH